MTRISRSRRIFASAIVASLTLVPLAGARPLERPAAVESEGAFTAALHWVENLFSFRRPGPADHGRRSGQPAEQRKEGSSTQGGSCIDPVGRPRPWCDV